MDQLYEYLLYNYNQRNENVISCLEDAIVDLYEIGDDKLMNLYRALSISKGYTECKNRELSTIIGVSKSAIKSIISNLEKENKIEVLRENSMTFLKPII